jgi:hypothetical protein
MNLFNASFQLNISGNRETFRLKIGIDLKKKFQDHYIFYENFLKILNHSLLNKDSKHLFQIAFIKIYKRIFKSSLPICMFFFL